MVVVPLDVMPHVITGFKMRVVTLNFYIYEGNIKDNPNLVTDSKLLTRF